MIDPGVCQGLAWAAVHAAAAQSSHREMSLAPFARLALGGWRPASHWLYHAGVRGAVGTTLTVALRLATADPPYPPLELWLLALHFFVREGWKQAPTVVGAAGDPPLRGGGVGAEQRAWHLCHNLYHHDGFWGGGGSGSPSHH